VVPVVCAGLACTIVLTGCDPVPAVTVVQSSVAIEGGSCQVVVDAANVAPSTTYGIGMYTTGSPVDIGELTSDASGTILGGRLSYPSDTVPRKYSNLYLEVYVMRSGQFGAGIASARVTTAC
jgi:hypothetical protein